ncbi:class I SAM-dependent methyltransferase [Phormidium sp. FACHB-592]|uniref:Class I SAM-dependent methyltransferase n=1 Tax=Stenomitos frigidus AS-A4 TaxID=2933935 RepID=A0ABV0KN46_9CYAN|nr:MULTISPECIES: class I SAM-dependent methyltransferase [Cyanophyceae]MBD2035448.1 class I SAM-dependent methyltransferase [Leptolyngbya sp. FACHB-321]MBD2074389.1 class I SAM-dependent methyltransferase [Phormidium sp. FACHB-592]
MQRVLEPEVMDTWEESVAYDAMDFTAVNEAFAERVIALAPESALVLDAGTGTARIPILLCQQRPQWQVIGIDRSKTMLQIGAANVKQAGLQAQITLADEDAKQLPYPNGYFDAVVSNSLVHHLPEPLPFLQELKRVLKPRGAIVLRDLLRPIDIATVDSLVSSIGDDYDAHQQQLFRDSLCAAFRLEELRALLDTAGLQDVLLYQSSDRHWTAERSWTG